MSVLPRDSWRLARMRVGASFVDNFFRGLSAAGRLHPLANPSRHGVEVLRDIQYREGDVPEHRLDVWRPVERAAPLPVVVYVHGGAFRFLSKDTHWVMALSFASRGYLVFNVGYRLAPRHPFPAAVEDVCDAWRFILAQAEALGGDPTRIVVAGESAGANLATTLAWCRARCCRCAGSCRSAIPGASRGGGSCRRS